MIIGRPRLCACLITPIDAQSVLQLVADFTAMPAICADMRRCATTVMIDAADADACRLFAI